MDIKQGRYVIPAGTRVEIRRENSAERLREHVTRKELRFHQIHATEWMGYVLQFQYQGWIISVNKVWVREEST